MKSSIIYKSIYVYRFIMNILYFGKYQNRFNEVIARFKADDIRILELCFGDTVIAEHCRRFGKSWTGLDISEAFIANAVSQGYDAKKTDLFACQAFPVCDVCVMMGSLYHFERHLPDLFEKIAKSSHRLIISEPIRNWTDGSGVCRFLARRLTRAEKGDETFRFNRKSLVDALNDLKKSVPFEFITTDSRRDMIVEVIWSK